MKAWRIDLIDHGIKKGCPSTMQAGNLNGTFETMNRLWLARQQFVWALLVRLGIWHRSCIWQCLHVLLRYNVPLLNAHGTRCLYLEASSLVFYLIFVIQHLYELTGILVPSSTVENVARSRCSLPDQKRTYATASNMSAVRMLFQDLVWGKFYRKPLSHIRRQSHGFP